MNGIPAFSIFSAISELFVTAFVLWGIFRTLGGKPLPKAILGGVLIFELCVNVVYMAGRAAEADKSQVLTTGMKIFFAVHGTLSLVMFLSLAAVFLIGLADEAKGNQNWFQRHRFGSYVIVFFWMVSVTTGEAIFYLHYLA